jgi:hypothetical protein
MIEFAVPGFWPESCMAEDAHQLHSVVTGEDFMRIKTLAAVTLLASAAALPAQAATLSTFPLWDNSTLINSWGGGATNTYGEVISALGSSLTSFTFAIDNFGVAGSYTAQVYAWSGTNTGGGQVGPALYTGALTVLPGVSGFQNVTVNTGGVAVSPGQRYAILLFDNSNNGVSASWGLIPPFGQQSGLPGDHGFFFNNGPSNVNGTFSDFGSLAFSADFTGAVPEPGTWMMMIAGFGLVGVSARRRKAAVAA